MPLDVLELREFYHSPLGQQAADILGAVLAENRYQTPVLMVGYGAAAWQAGVKDFGNVIMAMPAQQGVMAWPHDAPNQALLMEEGQMPFADQSFGSIIVIHALEQSLRPHDLMAECARVLRPEGQMVVLVPHRRGLWAQFDHTPVGVGQPYSPRQLRQLCHGVDLTVTGYGSALFWPPCAWPFAQKYLLAIEKFLRRWLGALGGVLIMKATKQRFAPIQRAGHARRLLPPLGHLRPATGLPQHRAQHD